MKSNLDPVTTRYLLLLKLDAQGLFHRIKSRKLEYVEIFAMKRSREHFKEIFWARYNQASLNDLTRCSEDTILTLDKFYRAVDDMLWYLNHTEDMPKTVDNELDYMIMHLEEHYQTLMLYIDAELGISQEEDESIEQEQGSESLATAEEIPSWEDSSSEWSDAVEIEDENNQEDLS